MKLKLHSLPFWILLLLTLTKFMLLVMNTVSYLFLLDFLLSMGLVFLLLGFGKLYPEKAIIRFETLFFITCIFFFSSNAALSFGLGQFKQVDLELVSVYTSGILLLLGFLFLTKQRMLVLFNILLCVNLNLAYVWKLMI